ncbi:MAG: cell division protein ZapE [Coxiella sp. RIFCSPHIGHO2_12_FULL_42_15]|nr:MAG: cell division protein ZapE [Coxiella sp. RIFCSPHIGHO2_12_FULL_42_15]
MTPFDYYSQQINAGLIQEDAQQREVIQRLQQIYEQLLKEQKRESHWSLRWLASFKKNTAIKGLYVWGSVGVGKTLIMDTFYLCCPVKKIRLHFHLFLQHIHAELKAIQGQVNPLKTIAKKIRREAKVICFDEFFVSNITDAMLLGELFQTLFEEGICLITTSNVAPDHLYKEGLQRERFLPAIQAIKQHTVVYHMISHHDYRLTHLQKAGVYFTPLNQQSKKYMENAFLHLAGDETIETTDVEVLGRQVKTIRHTQTMIWFNFVAICGIPRSQNDYIALAEQYHTVLVSDIPILVPNALNFTTAFINLIDVFYDANVRVVISAAADIEHLYPEGRLRFEFARTQSRLIEMQSTDYFNKRAR